MDRNDIKTKTEKIYEVLPQLDDQKCGYRSCGEFARLVAEGKAPCDGCVSGGPQVAAKVCEIMGVKLRQRAIRQSGFALREYWPGLRAPGGISGGMGRRLPRGRGMGWGHGWRRS